MEDAPRPLRIGYIKRTLGKFVGETRGGRQRREEPLDVSEAHEAFIALIREEADPWDFDSSSAWGALTEHLKSCEWSDFYDFVEMLGGMLKEKDDEIPFDETLDFKDYQLQVNALLVEDGIGWVLNDKSELVRTHPKVLAESLASTDAALSNKYQHARTHYQKAAHYLHRHPIDEANSIKEIISAVESVARAIEPKASTLGEALKRLRKDPRFNPGILEPMEKLYAYANATALVRHGHATGRKPTVEDAELALLIGVAYIRHLIAASERDV